MPGADLQHVRERLRAHRAREAEERAAAREAGRHFARVVAKVEIAVLFRDYLEGEHEARAALRRRREPDREFHYVGKEPDNNRYHHDDFISGALEILDAAETGEST